MPSSPDESRSGLGEEAMVFACESHRLLGILHHADHADHADHAAELGILIVTGGPQYRIGSHRQFLLLARAFAAAGVPAFRFDHRGSGDSGGPFLGFEGIEQDIDAAITAFAESSAGLKRVVLWGICDAASAILLYAARDPRVAGIVLVNPWVREETGEDRAMVKHYYGRRLFEAAFWRKLLSGEVALFAALRDFAARVFGWLKASLGGRAGRGPEPPAPLPARMAQGLSDFRGAVGLIISGRDLTAREFEDAANDPLWRRLLAEDRVDRHDLPTADHTFSRRVWRESVASWTLSWVKGLAARR